MPKIARWYIKTALIYLILALATGLMVALDPAFLRSVPLGPVFIHLFVVGWLTQLIFGVAYWLFPRHSREQPYGPNLRLVPASYVLLNAGLLLRVVGEPLHATRPAWGMALAVSGLLQALAVILYAAYLWPRVKRK